MNKRERAAKTKQEDAALNRVMAWIAGSVVLESLLLLLNRYYNNYKVSEIETRVMLETLMGVMALVLPLCLVAAGVWWYLTRKKGKSTVLPQALTTVAGVLAACAVLIHFYGATGVKALYVAVPCLAVLVLIYYLYQREFFLVTAVGGAGILGLWLQGRRLGHGLVVYGYLVLELVFLVGVVLVARRLQTGDGLMTFRGKEIRPLGKSVNYTMLYVTCGVVAAIQVLGLVLGSAMYLYAALIVWLLAMAVYYTVRLM